MKKISICLFAAAALLGVGCEDNVPEPGTMEVPVQSVTLAEELQDGVVMEVGTTLNVALKVNVLPENATDLAELFYSSNVDVATVSPKGIVTAQKAGITMISIYVGGIETYFTVKVVDQIPVDIESMEFGTSDKEMELGGTDLDLISLLSILPLNQNEGVIFTSSDPTVASIDQNGMLHALKIGKTVITAVPKRQADAGPELTATMNVQVVQIVNEDYVRTGWSMSFSHTIPGTSTTVKEQGALDGDLSTFVQQVRPGKSLSGVSVPAGQEIFFIVDMATEHEVNYFRIHHRSTNSNEVRVRWFGFDEILGSNDGNNFTSIVTQLVVPNADIQGQEISENIKLPNTVKYRYLKFVGKTVSFCWVHPTANWAEDNAGNTVQIKELYLGLETKITE